MSGLDLDEFARNVQAAMNAATPVRCRVELERRIGTFEDGGAACERLCIDVWCSRAELDDAAALMVRTRNRMLRPDEPQWFVSEIRGGDA